MKQYSDQEEGFIASEVEVKKQLIKFDNFKQLPTNINPKNFQVKYRFAVGFLKKEPSLAYNTPLTLRNEGKGSQPSIKRKQKLIQIHQHPFKEYEIGQKYSLKYCRQPNQPLLYQHNFIKNQVPLFNIDDKNSTLWKEIKPFQIQQSAINKDDLYFDSRFQSGNLHCAFRKNHEHEYHLFMSNDTNTLGYNQWFYFSIQNARKGVKYTFKIVNYRKLLNFYRNGQQITVFSMKEALKCQSGWYRAGTNISFEQSVVRADPQSKMYTLSFDLEFHHEKDYIMIASTIPYSYSKMIQDIHEIKQESEKIDKVNVSISTFCKSICNNDVPEITITNKNSEKKDNQKKDNYYHGTTTSRRRVMRSLLKTNPQNQYLLDHYIIKIYPMINVDGVIYGNFRCDVTGVDLNRRWRDPSKIFHPQIFQIKKKIQAYNKKWKIQLCFDLHGHSKNYNFFCYACKQNNYTCRILPYLIQSQNSMFHMPSCTFGLTKDKQSTARATISKIIRHKIFGYRPNVQCKSFNPLDIFRMAQSILIATRYFLDKNSSKYQQSENNIRINYNEYLSYDQQNEQESGSDSQPEKDQIQFKVKLNTIFDKKFEKEYKSFIRQDGPLQIHNTKIIFDGLQQSTKKIDASSDTLIYPQNANISLLIGQNQIDNDFSQNKSINKKTRYQILQKGKQRYKSHDINEKQKDNKTNSVMYRITVGANSDFKQASTQRKNQNLKGTKNILIRDKKRLSLADNRQKKSLDKISFKDKNEDDQIHKSKQLKKEDNGKAIQQFVSRFERFMPNTLANRARNKLDILEKELQQDDPQQQLNIMRQNKRRLQLQKIKIRLSIEDSTEVAERQGRIKCNRKQPIITYNRFKQTDKIKNQIRKLGQFSQRYFDRHN